MPKLEVTRHGKNKFHELCGVQLFKRFSTKFVNFSTKFGFSNVQIRNKFKNFIFTACKWCNICNYYVNSMVILYSTCQKEEKECIWNKYLIYKVPQSNFLSTVNFNFDHVSFFGIFCLFLRTSRSHWVSATKESIVGHKKGVFWPFLWPNQWFLCRTDSLFCRNFKFVVTYMFFFLRQICIPKFQSSQKNVFFQVCKWL